MKYGKETVHIPSNMNPRPTDAEKTAAEILSVYFQSDVYFRRRRLLKTSDIEINGAYWEIKSPTGNGKRTIQNNLRKADDQSKNVIVDLRYCKMHNDKAIAKIRFELSRAHKIKRLLVITKSKKVVEIL